MLYKYISKTSIWFKLFLVITSIIGVYSVLVTLFSWIG